MARPRSRLGNRPPVDNEYCGVFGIRDGRIAEVREYLDSLHAAQVLFSGFR
jgi:ketosteroid isomerase-like protein